MQRKLVLIVVDGMTPAAFERAVESGRSPALSFLAEHGEYRRATSVFPSLTPVCLTSIATGAGPGVQQFLPRPPGLRIFGAPSKPEDAMSYDVTFRYSQA